MNAALKPINVASADCQLISARISPDGTTVAAGGVDGSVRRWKVAEKALEPMPHVQGHHAFVGGLAFHPTKPWLYTGDSWGRLRCQTFAEEAPTVVWELEAAHQSWLRQLAISPDGAQLATCGRDKMARLWTAEGKPVAEYQHDDDLFAVTFTPDGSQVVLADLHGHLLVWDYKTKKITRKMDATATYKADRLQEICGLRVLAFSQDGKLLYAAGTIVANGGTIQSTPALFAYEFASGKLLHKFTHGDAKDGFIEDLAIHPNGSLIGVTSGNPGTGKIIRFKPEDKDAFDSATPLANCQAVAIHPDGQRFIVVSTNRDSAGNGKRVEKDGSYAQNTSPVNLFDLPDALPKAKTKADADAALDAALKTKVP